MNRFPNIRAIVRDIAVFVPSNEKVENVLDIIENTTGKLLIDTDLFDIYENDEKKKSGFPSHLPIAGKNSHRRGSE